MNAPILVAIYNLSAMRKLLQPFNELGLMPGLVYLADRLVSQLFGRRAFYYYSIVSQPVVEPRLRPGKDQKSQLCESWDDIAEYAVQLGTQALMFRDRFNRGYKCVVLACRGELLAYAWLALSGYQEDEVRCFFLPAPTSDTGWDFDVYVCPNHRGTLTFARLWDAINRCYAEQGRHCSVSRISRFNATSLQSHRSLGARRVADTLFVVLGPVQIMLASVWPFVHLSLSDRSWPTLRIDVNRL